MKRFVVGFLAVIGAFALIAGFVGLVVGLVSLGGKERVPSQVILELDLDGEVVEHVPPDPFAQAMLDEAIVLQDLVDALERGAEDDRVTGLVARVGTGSMGLAQIQEIRDAVFSFRASGKPAVAYAETFGEVGPGNGSYYLATAFDEIYLQPSGDVGATGLIYETMFLRGTLDKLGIIPRMDHRYEYKNAMNTLTDRKYTEPHREAMQAIVDSQFGQMVRGIAEARGMEEQDVRELFDRGPFLGREALEAGLVDGLGYRDEVLEAFREKVGGEHPMLYADKYLERAGRPHRRGDTIALVYGVGSVLRGQGGYDPLTGDFAMGADSVSAALREALEDDSVKAIVFRVDSPGGSYVASDTIWRETIRAREMGKPVVVSMGNLAGSGGYFVAMSADKIVAQPGTITASIGVLGGKFLTDGFWDKLGMNWQHVQSSSNATMWTGTEDYTEAEYARFQAWLDRVYEDFTTKVASGRNMEIEQVRKIAKGRIWTGEDALRLGLVDEMGGVPKALDLAREAAGIPTDEPVRVRVYPRPRSTFDMLFGKGPDSSEKRSVEAAIAASFRRVQPVLRVLREAGVYGEEGVLAMPPVGAAR